MEIMLCYDADGIRNRKITCTLSHNSKVIERFKFYDSLLDNTSLLTKYIKRKAAKHITL
jgi:hypothetical protein